MPRRKLIDIVGDQELLFTTPDAPIQGVAKQMAARHVAAILVVEFSSSHPIGLSMLLI